VLSSAIGALGDRMDAKFMTAYWLPAFVFTLGGLCALGLMVGPGQIDAWISGLDSVEQTLGVAIIVLIVSMLAFILRALTRPITEVYAGIAIASAVAAWSTRGQLGAKQWGEQLLGAPMHGITTGDATQVSVLQGRFPKNDANLQPTLFGNIIASASEHPRAAYSMEGMVWWSRLTPLLPGSFVDTLAGAQAPIMALLNLSTVFCGLAIVILILGAITAQWLVAGALVICSIVISWLGYRAAVSQAAEVSSMLRVAFDLYRYDILDQLGIDHPADLAAERALWPRLTREILGLPPEAAPVKTVGAA